MFEDRKVVHRMQIDRIQHQDLSLVLQILQQAWARVPKARLGPCLNIDFGLKKINTFISIKFGIWRCKLKKCKENNFHKY